MSFESNIITSDDTKDEYIKFLSKHFKKDVKLERKYSAKSDGFSAANYHNKTDDISQRIILIKNEHDTLFGGYITKSCNSTSDKWIDDPNAFVYQFKPESSIFEPKQDTGIINVYT